METRLTTESADIAGTLCLLLAEACNVESSVVSPRTDLLQLNIDSLTLVSVLTQLETIYGFELSPDDILRFLEVSVVADMLDRLKSLIARSDVS